MKTIYHKHHIIPRHAGGTDDPFNLVKLTIEEHADAHKKLFEEHGRWQDKAAYEGLTGMLTTQELIYVAQVEGGRMSKSTSEQCRMAANTLWNKPGMREHLIQKRKEQINPMKGKKHKRVCCIFCKKETAVNTFASNHKQCK